MLLLLVMACVTDPEPGEDLCARADATTGRVSGGWSGDDQNLQLSNDFGGWSDGCYGGTIEGPYTAEGGAFDWPAAFFVGAGAPEQRPVRAVGCVAGDWIDLSIVEEDGTPFWGPWRLERQDGEVEIVSCD